MHPRNFLDKVLRSSFARVMSREFSRIGNSWVLIFVTTIAPLASFLLVVWMFSQAVVRELPISIVDMDHTQLSRKIARMVDAGPAVDIVFQSASLAEARARIADGKEEAVLYLPKGLEKDLQKGLQTELALFFNNSNLIKGGVIQSQMVNTIAMLSGTVKVQRMVNKGVPQQEAVQKAQPIRPNTHLLFNPYGNYAYFLVTGLLPLLAVVFIFLGTAYAIGIEMKEGTGATWLHTAGNSATVALLGKLTPYLLLFFVNLTLMNLLLIKTMGVPLNGSLGMILFSEVLLILSYQSMALLFLTFTTNLRLTLSLGSAYTMMALTFSGLTFPTMGMDPIARIFSWIFPYTFWLKVFLGQSLRREPIEVALYPMLMLLPFIALGILSIPFFKKRVTDERWQTRD
jgi:ABC-2 type transport system permease protein